MKPPGFLIRVVPLVVAVSLAGCAVGPDYHQPPPPATAGYLPGLLPGATPEAENTRQSLVMGQDIAGDWWALFHSPELNSLIAAALAHNPNLAVAQDTLVEAGENLRAEQGAFVPSISAGFQAERERISSAEIANTGSVSTAQNAESVATIPPFSLYNASINLSYTLDVFGGVRRQVESLAAERDYERYELEAAYLSLTANIVTEAVTEASLKGQIDATNQIISIEQSELGILRQQVALGGVAMADVINQQATLASAQANLPPLESQLAQARNQLAVYVGALPADFHVDDFTLGALHLPDTLPVSLPSALVAQRPDIQAAAAQLHEATANVGIATANMLPQITLSADVGHEALEAAQLFTPQTLMWSLVAGITQPIFEGGTLNARRKSAIASMRATGAQYQATVLTAFQDVANALQALQFDAETLALDQLAAATAQRSLSVTQAQYRLGGQPFTAVLTAQTTYQNAVVARVKAEAARLADTAALFQALGGGWWHRDDVSQATKSCCGLIP